MNAILKKYSIIVDIPPPEEEVFIAIPFQDEFKQLENAIQLACNKIDLKPKATNINSESPKWLDDITQMTRRARVVVAVCSPEASTKKPNPNVMYELGFAASIGKATVILTSDITTLPADIQNQNVLVYKQDEIENDGFAQSLQIAIGKAQSRARNHITDSFITDVRFAEIRDWTYIYPELWLDYVHILYFAKDVHTVFQNFIAPLDEINRSATKAGDDPGNRMQCQKNFTNDYGKREQDFQNNITRNARDWDEKKAIISGAINKLNTNTITASLIGKVPNCYNTAIKAIDNYIIKSEALHTWVITHENVVIILGKGDKYKFMTDLTDLLCDISKLVMLADQLIYNMIDMLPRGGQHE